MQKAEVCKIARKMFGQDWQSPMARALNMHRTTLWRWRKAKGEITPALEKTIRALMKSKLGNPDGPPAICAKSGCRDRATFELWPPGALIEGVPACTTHVGALLSSTGEARVFPVKAKGEA